MASVDAGGALQSAIQAAVQPKLMENGWVVEENDTTLSEYVTMMIVNGKDLQGVQSELGGDLLGVGEDDPAVGEFARWLFDQVQALSAPQQQAQTADASQEQAQPIPSTQDAQMEDSASTDTPYVHHPHPYGNAMRSNYAGQASHPYSNGQMPFNMLAMRQMYLQQLMRNAYSPTGPRSMRNGGGPRGRGGRMLGQMNRNMDRSTDLPDNLRRIKGAAGGVSGRINSHAGRDGPPRGPKNNLANGMNRMMNGRGRGGHPGNMNPMSAMGNGGAFDPQQQMQFMQMMEASAQMMAQVLQQNGGVQFGNQRGGHRGGKQGARGGRSQTGSKTHAVDGKLPDGPLTSNGGSGMELDGEENKSDMFSTMCRFNLACTNPGCGFAHQSPAAPPNTSVDLADTCAHGIACTNFKCVGRHPSPAQRSSHKQEVDCKFYPNCTNPSCPFRHPTAKPCRNGADCSNPNCTFAHSKIVCRYNPCLNPACPFKHTDGQKRGKFEDKVWTSENGEGGKSERFADFSKPEGQEELIIPGQNGDSSQQTQTEETQAMEAEMPT